VPAAKTNPTIHFQEQVAVWREREVACLSFLPLSGGQHLDVLTSFTVIPTGEKALKQQYWHTTLALVRLDHWSIKQPAQEAGKS
jgi:hypothetical protein